MAEAAESAPSDPNIARISFSNSSSEGLIFRGCDFFRVIKVKLVRNPNIRFMRELVIVRKRIL
jgi:hypothetical protein